MDAVSTPPEGSTILMVDDTPANLAVVARCLEDRGFRVLVAQDGAEAMERVRYATPDLILLDVMMPGIDGFTICRQLKADSLTRDIPVIFMTALENTEDKVAAFEAGAVDYVTKPFATAEVLARVRTHLSLHHLQQRLVARTRQLEEEAEERGKAENELRTVNAELDSFAHAVSHDLRNPLRSINGCAQMLQSNCGDRLGDDGRPYLQEIIRSSQKMGELIEGLLRLSRGTRGEMEFGNVDLTAIAERIRTDLEHSAPERRVDWQISPGLKARGDAQLLEVVLRNLLDNAWKYTAATPQPRISIHSEMNGDRLWFYVADNGAGFDMQKAGKLFKPFQRLHRQEEFPGIGIGLATVQRIIHRHGGSIDAKAARGQGATFRFTLPAAEE